MEQAILKINQNISDKTKVKILFLSAENTGSGHRSITESLKHQLKILNPNVEINVVDGFALGGKPMTLLGNSYNFFAVNTPLLWSFVYSLGEYMDSPAVSTFAVMIKKRLLRCIEEVQPDIIVSVHALFLGSVLNVLKKNNLDIPVIPIIADLDNVTRLWADKRSKCTICPSIESKKLMISAGLPEEKIKVTGFPVRAEFCEPIEEKYEEFKLKDKLKFLIVSGSQGSRQILDITESLLKSENSFVTIIAGRNSILKSYLERELSAYIGTRVNILGFTNEIQKHMLESDILVVRASPNVLMEAINLNKPVIVTGSLMGQEAKNPDYILKYNLGVVCKDVKRLPAVVESLLADNCKRIKDIKANQKNFIKKNAALEIAEIILDEYYEKNKYDNAK